MTPRAIQRATSQGLTPARSWVHSSLVFSAEVHSLVLVLMGHFQKLHDRLFGCVGNARLVIEIVAWVVGLVQPKTFASLRPASNPSPAWPTDCKRQVCEQVASYWPSPGWGGRHRPRRPPARPSVSPSTPREHQTWISTSRAQSPVVATFDPERIRCHAP